MTEVTTQAPKAFHLEMRRAYYDIGESVVASIVNRTWAAAVAELRAELDAERAKTAGGQWVTEHGCVDSHWFDPQPMGCTHAKTTRRRWTGEPEPVTTVEATDA